MSSLFFMSRADLVTGDDSPLASTTALIAITTVADERRSDAAMIRSMINSILILLCLGVEPYLGVLCFTYSLSLSLSLSLRLSGGGKQNTERVLLIPTHVLSTIFLSRVKCQVSRVTNDPFPCHSILNIYRSPRYVTYQVRTMGRVTIEKKFLATSWRVSSYFSDLGK
jgi:hypothetical protein